MRLAVTGAVTRGAAMVAAVAAAEKQVAARAVVVDKYAGRVRACEEMLSERARLSASSLARLRAVVPLEATQEFMLEGAAGTRGSVASILARSKKG